MTVVTKSLTGASFAKDLDWEAIDWPAVRRQVKQIQMRIAKAIRENRYGRAKALQHLLSRSFSAKLLAVKRVTGNSGSKTAGVDGVKWTTPKEKIRAVFDLNKRGYKTKPLRRIYIPKKNGKQRPLSIPTIKCRAMQALYLFGLEPIAETLADPNAYGFRPKRSTADAIEQCFKLFARKCSVQWLLEGDIKACFDKINHDWLLANIPMDKVMLRKWLKAGYMENKTVFTTDEGTPQGGIISPCLLTMTLRGLESALKDQWPARNPHKVHLVTYADDFIVTGSSMEFLENKIKPIIASFLKERGLELSVEKTKISHISKGFDFLGFNVRKYQNKLLIKPAPKSVKAFIETIRALIKKNRTVQTEVLIRQLNPKILGWANYYRHVVSSQAFSRVDNLIFNSIWKWCKRRHPNKTHNWVKKRYFKTQKNDNWVFATPDSSKNEQLLTLIKAKHTHIVRHIKIKADATPYDPKYFDYFNMRSRTRKTGSN
jgi:RNA-directed DNA polymerase